MSDNYPKCPACLKPIAADDTVVCLIREHAGGAIVYGISSPLGVLAAGMPFLAHDECAKQHARDWKVVGSLRTRRHR